MDECELCYGDQVQLIDEQIGTIRYIGEISYGHPSKGKNKNGIFYGIELKSKTGQHNGSIRGRIYFKCAPRLGIFVRIKDIECILKTSKHKSTRYHINQLIFIKNKEQLGTIRYIGLCPHLDTSHNAGGLWFGIESSPEHSRGKYKTEGIIQNIVYFKSSTGCNALFVQASNLSQVPKHILDKLKAAEPPPLVVKKKTKKGDKERRRSSVFDILKGKLADAFGKDTTEDAPSANHSKSASVTTAASDNTEATQQTRRRTRLSRSQSTPRNPDPNIGKKDLVDPTPVHTTNKRQHKIPYDLTKKRQQQKPKAKKHNNNNSLVTTKREKKRMQNQMKRSHSANPNEFKSKSKQRHKDAQHRPKNNSSKRPHKRYNKHRHNKTQEEGRIDHRPRRNKNARPRTPTAPKKARRNKSPRRPKTPDAKDSNHIKQRRKRSHPKPNLRNAHSAYDVGTQSRDRSTRTAFRAKKVQNHASISPRGGGGGGTHPMSWSPQVQNGITPHAYNEVYSFQKPSALRDQQQQSQFPQQHLASPDQARIVEAPIKRVKNGKNGGINERATIYERAKLMMTSLPFSHSSGVNQLDVMADNDVFNNPEYKKRKKNKRSRTRDVGELSEKILNEKRTKKPRSRKKNTKSLNNLKVKGHGHQRSKSLEINIDDLLAKGDEDDDDSAVSDLEEYVFTSSSEDWSDDSDDTSDDSKEDDPTLSLWVGTWNVGESEFEQECMSRWLGSNSSAMHRMHDVYVVGLQECVSQHRKAWMNGILAYLDNGRKQYLVIQKMHLMNILLIVIVNKLYMFRIRDIKCKTVACGKGNIIGNKGAVAITMTFDETTFAFVNVHLVARAERFVQRMENIERIFKNIDSASMGTFAAIDCLNQFHHVILFGDLNYRIMKDFWEVCDLIRSKRYCEFAICDQLNHQMETSEILYGFREGDIRLLPPTYRWERNANVVSNKREQAPSYTDRILYKSLPECYSFWQTKYKSCMRCYGSDHRPMMSIFRFVPRNLPRHNKKRRKGLKNIDICFYEMRAFIDMTKSKANGLELSDTICCNLYYKYSSSNSTADAVDKIDGGKYDALQRCWCWSLDVLDSVSIMPYILDLEFLVGTHVHLQITNSSKSHSIIGYSVIPLWNVFPQSLVDRDKLKTKYNPLFGDEDCDSAAQITQNDRNNSLRKKRRKRVSDKEFNSPITILGNYIGDIKGLIHAQSELVEKHRRINTKQKYK
eukprot:274365_1